MKTPYDYCIERVPCRYVEELHKNGGGKPAAEEINAPIADELFELYAERELFDSVDVFRRNLEPTMARLVEERLGCHVPVLERGNISSKDAYTSVTEAELGS